MSEFLDECHLCGSPMASAAPICPKCFARSDPVAREARYHAKLLEKAQARLRQRIAQQQQISAARVLIFLVIVLALIFLIPALLTYR